MKRFMAFSNMTKRRMRYGILLCCLPFSGLADTGVDDLIVSQSFTISATITQGCFVGGGSADVSSFGTLNFGSISGLTSAVQVASTQGAGSIVLKCTPGMTGIIAIDKGTNASSGIALGRLLKQANGSSTLTYQLYKDSGFSVIWGDGLNGGTTQPFSGTGIAQEIKVYGRLSAVASLPPAGRYTDTVVVTITY